MFAITIPLVVAILAPLVNCLQLLPQLHKTYNTKSAKDLSIGSLGMILLTEILWLLHGYFIMDFALIVASGVALSINLSLIGFVCYYRRVCLR